jgi:integrase
MTLRDIFDHYLEFHSMPRGNGRTDETLLRSVMDEFGGRGVSMVTDATVSAYTKKRLAGYRGRPPVKPSTVRREIGALQAVLNYGVRKGLIEGNFNFQKPNDGPPRDRWINEAQEREILSHLSDAPLTVRIFLRLGLTYGARKGAIMDLHFGPQVNFITNTIDFNVPGARKTRKRRPVVPMTADVRGDMEEMFHVKRHGARICAWETPYLFKRFMGSIGYGWVTPHVLKHSAITLMLRGGARVEDVSALTNTDIRTIQSVYRHHSAGELLAIAEKRR